MASDGLLAANNSLSMAVRGLLDTSGVIVVVAVEKLIGYVSNVGIFMNR